MQAYSPLRILLVEDSDDDVEIARRALKRSRFSYELIVARDGQEALDMLFNDGAYRYTSPARPDLILLDLNLPKVGGFEVLESVRATERFSGTPIVILTTSTREEDVARGYRLGANTYIRKPSNLLKTIEMLGEYWGALAQLPRA